MWLLVRCGGWLAAAVVVSGCAGHRPQTVADRYVRGEPPHVPATESSTSAPSSDRTAPEDPSGASGSPLHGPPKARTLEESNADLSAARLRLATAPTAGNHRLVAQIYARLGVLDAAYDHFSAAVLLARNDAAAYDGRARVWRDWGFAPLALSDAYRAIHYAPTSPVPQNTLGTLLLKMGLLPEAQAAFARALVLDPRASYALANLCAVSRRLGDTVRVSRTCLEEDADAPAP
jgi:tetratricopeptide (TPR) repeat protein